MPAAALEAIGCCYLWWKGWSLSDVIFVIKHNMANAVATVSKQLEHVSEILASTKKHLSKRLETLDWKLDEQKEILLKLIYEQKEAPHAMSHFYHNNNSKIIGTVPKLNLDAAFEQKNDIAKAVEQELKKAMSHYRYEIVQTLIVDIEPDEHVKKSMNELNQCWYLKLVMCDDTFGYPAASFKSTLLMADIRCLLGT